MTKALTRLCLLCVSLCLMGVVITYLLLQILDARTEQRDDHDLQIESLAIVTHLTAGEEPLRRALARLPVGAEGRAAIHLPDRRTIGNGRAAPEVIQEIAATGHATTVDHDGDLTRFVPVPRPEAGTAVLEIRIPDSGIGRVFTVQLLLLLAGGACAATAALLIAWSRARALGITVDTLAEAVRSLGSDRPVPPVAPNGPVELIRLRTALADAAIRWAQLRTDERKLMANLSHRLRTPLTALRLDTETVTDDVTAERIRNSISALESEVDEVIRNTDGAQQNEDVTTDIGEAVRTRMAFWATLADDQQRQYRLDLTEEPAPVELPRHEIQDVLDNLLVNVFRHTPQGAPFAVFVVVHAGWVTLVVDDGGPGIGDPESAVRRGSSGHGSTGLGLDIAKKCAERRGGSIHVQSSSLGGARIRLRLPVAGSVPSAEPPRAWRLWRGRHRPPPHVDETE